MRREVKRSRCKGREVSRSCARIYTVRHGSRLARNCRLHVNAIPDRPFQAEDLAQVPSLFLPPLYEYPILCTLTTFDVSTRIPFRTYPGPGQDQSKSPTFCVTCNPSPAFIISSLTNFPFVLSKCRFIQRISLFSFICIDDFDGVSFCE